jgi:flagellar hook protein FlgE
VDLNPLAPAATTEIQMNALLSAEADFATTPLTSGTLDIVTGTGDTLEDAANAADFATSVTVYDSLGQAHEVTILYERTGTNDYNWFAVVDAGELDAPAGTYTAGDAFTIASGTTTFDTAGDLTAFTQTNTSGATAWNFVGAAAGDYVFDFGVDVAGNPADGQVRLLSGESAVSAISQDGYPPGDLISLSVDTEGVITGQFSNGQDIQLGRVVLARFPSNAGLERVGNTLFRETLASGQPAIGQPDTGGRGKVIGNALEKSNVDLEDEFVNMITSQRTYQANARMIGTANDTLQELVQLV